MNKKEVLLYTDGSCSGNPGPGGYAAILIYNNHKKELCGGSEQTTNNRMELTAVIEGLKALKEPCHVIIYSDSKYIVDAFKEGWIDKWQKNNWCRGKNEKVKNIDLWEELLEQLSRHSAEFNWVKGHNGHEENERCDELAVLQTQKYACKSSSSGV